MDSPLVKVGSLSMGVFEGWLPQRETQKAPSKNIFDRKRYSWAALTRLLCRWKNQRFGANVNDQLIHAGDFYLTEEIVALPVGQADLAGLPGP